MWFQTLHHHESSEAAEALRQRVWDRWGVAPKTLQGPEIDRLLRPCRLTAKQIQAGAADQLLRQCLAILKKSGVLAGWAPELTVAADAADVNLRATISALETLAISDPSMVPLLEDARALHNQTTLRMRQNYL